MLAINHCMLRSLNTDREDFPSAAVMVPQPQSNLKAETTEMLRFTKNLQIRGFDQLRARA
jgi:hypothetical protein